MHTYSSDSKERTVVLLIIALLSVGLAFLYHGIGFTMPWWIESPSLLTLFGILVWLHDHHVWKVRLFSQIPNLNGTWFGEIKSSYDNFNTPYECMVTIHQTWSKMQVQLKTKTSNSDSIMAVLNVEPGPQQGLTYEYINQPRGDAVKSMEIHRGVVSLKQSNDCKMLDGNYYTGRGRQNNGTMLMYLISKEYLYFDQARNSFNSREN